MTPTWFGLLLAHDQHRLLPWWRKMIVPPDGAETWTRSDGTLLDLGVNEGAHTEWDRYVLRELLAIDRAKPLPCPAPFPDQVWWLGRGRDRSMPKLVPVDAVRLSAGNEPHRVDIGGVALHMSRWPVRDSVLVAGQGAPWASIDTLVAHKILPLVH